MEIKELLPKLFALVSLVLALLLLLCTAIFISDYTDAVENCSKIQYPPGYKPIFDPCAQVNKYAAGAAFAIMVSLIGMGSTVMALLKKWIIWCILHCVIFFFALIAFSLLVNAGYGVPGFDYSGTFAAGAYYAQYMELLHRYRSTLAFSCLYWLFALPAVPGVFFLTKNAGAGQAGGGQLGGGPRRA